MTGASALTGNFPRAMYEPQTIAAQRVLQSQVHFFKPFVLAAVVALPNPA